MALLVELVGAPGAGKTTLAGALDGFRAAGGTVRPATDLARPPRRGLPRPLGRRLAPPEDPRVLRRALDGRAAEWDDLLRLVLADRPSDPRAPALRLEALGWTRHALALTALVHAEPTGIFVLEEGVMQRVTAALGPVPTPEDADRFATLAPRADLVLHLVADDATLTRRLDPEMRGGRVNARYVGLGPAALRAAVHADAELLARVVGTAAAQGARVVVVDAGDGAEAVAAARSAVSRLGGPAAGSATAA